MTAFDALSYEHRDARTRSRSRSSPGDEDRLEEKFMRLDIMPKPLRRGANFLLLPVEIRWMIYQHALSDTRVAVGWDGTWDFGRRELQRTPYALMRTCKRVYADIVDAWPQWCLVDLGPLKRYNSVKMLDIISRIPISVAENLQTLCVSAFHIVVFRRSPQPDQVVNGFSFFGLFRHLNLKRLLLRWDDTISSPSSPNNHDYQYSIIREQLVKYGTGWRELYCATPFETLVSGLDLEIRKRDGIDSGACASLILVKQHERGPFEDDPEFRCIYDALTNSAAKGVAHVIVVKRGQNVNIHEPPSSTPVINDPHDVQWFKGAGTWSESATYGMLRRTFVA